MYDNDFFFFFLIETASNVLFKVFSLSKFTSEIHFTLTHVFKISTCNNSIKNNYSLFLFPIIADKTFSSSYGLLFYFLLPISRESIVFGSNFRHGDFDGFKRFEFP